MFALETKCSRGAALAEAFFFQLDNDLKKQLCNQLEHEDLKERLQTATGIRDPQLLDYMAQCNFQPSAVTALMLVPSIFVAWADGWVTDDEDRAVLAIAIAKGLGSDDDSMAIIQQWLQTRPPQTLWNLWCEYARTLYRTMPPRYYRSLRDEVLIHAKTVAKASGGWMGFGKVSRAEQQILDETERVMNEPNQVQPQLG